MVDSGAAPERADSVGRPVFQHSVGRLGVWSWSPASRDARRRQGCVNASLPACLHLLRVGWELLSSELLLGRGAVYRFSHDISPLARMGRDIEAIGSENLVSEVLNYVPLQSSVMIDGHHRPAEPERVGVA
jgi:hypothetical protein